MSGLDAEQLDELEYRVAGLLEEPWDKGEGRPRELTLREALVVTCGYLRQNIIEDLWAASSTSTSRQYRGTSRFFRHSSRKQQKKTGRRKKMQRRPPEERSCW